MAHEHCHHHGVPDHNRAFAIGVILNSAYIIVEAGYGLATHSLALVADAGHNLSDVLGLLLAWGASRLALQPPTKRYTYGYRSSSILAAIANALLLLLAVAWILWESTRRLMAPEPVPPISLMVVAGIGVVINTATAMLFMRGKEHDLNIRGAYLHMAADAAVSLGVVIAGFGIYLFGWLWLDPVIGLVIAVVILWGTWSLLRDSVNLSLRAVPPGIDPEEVSRCLTEMEGVEAVHDLHIWAMSTTEIALTAHIVRPGHTDNDQLLWQASKELHDRFHIDHATIQIEQDPNACKLAPQDVV